MWGHGLLVIYHDQIDLLSYKWFPENTQKFITLLLLFSFVRWSLQMFLYYERKRQ